jgi:hypothetical protein
VSSSTPTSDTTTTTTELPNANHIPPPPFAAPNHQQSPQLEHPDHQCRSVVLDPNHPSRRSVTPSIPHSTKSTEFHHHHHAQHADAAQYLTEMRKSIADGRRIPGSKSKEFHAGPHQYHHHQHHHSPLIHTTILNDDVEENLGNTEKHEQRHSEVRSENQRVSTTNGYRRKNKVSSMSRSSLSLAHTMAKYVYHVSSKRKKKKKLDRANEF